MLPLAAPFGVLGETLRDVLPIATILVTFQFFVLRQAPPSPKRLLVGFAYAIAGLTLFLLGLDQALFPLGRIMAAQLTDPAFIGGGPNAAAVASVDPSAYVWVYAFAGAIGFSATIAEPALIAVALKADELSAGAIKAHGLRIAVAVGVAIGVTLGVFRIVVGAPLHELIAIGYVVVVVQTLFAPRFIVPLAYDSGGVTTSTVTVPILAALGLGLAETVPGRSPLIDGFGLIAFASLFPMISVLAYAQASAWYAARNTPADAPPTGDSNASGGDPACGSS
ncbi:MAG: DUF1538 domain-containing protein [Deltaproteobacteria bacterium]|nr:MAG: DUF1538 domain-containing protein [Deltaproteobacteria bacterium]